MIDACIEKGLRKPEFIQEEDFCTIIWRRDKVNDKIKPTTSYIAKKTHLSYPTVQRIIRFLVDNDLVHRKGSDKTGYWVADK